MRGPTSMRSRRSLSALAGAILLGLPLAAFLLAPGASAQSTPGADLGGFNTEATSTAVQFEPLTPGIVGAGNVAKGNLVQVSVPYVDSTASTGPTTETLAAPAWPGQTASQLGNAFATASPQFPPSSVDALLNDSALAQADYPPQVGAGSSSHYQPPTGAAAFTADAQASDSGTDGSASITDTTFPGGLEVASGVSSTSASVQADSVQTEAKTSIGRISLMGGAIQIAGVYSDALASSNGTTSQQSSTLQISGVTVAGLSASIGPDGITVNKTSPLNPLVPLANQALQALQQAGISVTTIQPTEQQQGGSVSVTSGALQFTFIDAHIPNPQGRLPIGNSAGVEVDLGLSQATADATPLPPLTPFSFPSPSLPPAPAAVATATAPIGFRGGATTETITTGGGTGSPSLAAPYTNGRSSAQGPGVLQPVGLLGLPVRTAWIVAAVLLSIVASGPLLAYANWQLLKGRRT